MLKDLLPKMKRKAESDSKDEPDAKKTKMEVKEVSLRFIQGLRIAISTVFA